MACTHSSADVPFLPLSCLLPEAQAAAPLSTPPMVENFAELLRRYQLSFEFYPRSTIQNGLKPLRIIFHIVKICDVKSQNIPEKITLCIRVPATQILDEDYKEKTRKDLIETAQKIGNPEHLGFVQYLKSETFLGSFCNDPVPSYNVNIRRNRMRQTLCTEISLKLGTFPRFTEDRKYSISIKCTTQNYLDDSYKDFIIQEFSTCLATMRLEEESYSESSFRAASQLKLLAKSHKILSAYSKRSLVCADQPLPLRKRSHKLCAPFDRSLSVLNDDPAILKRQKRLGASSPILSLMTSADTTAVAETSLSLLAMTASTLTRTKDSAENYTLSV